MNISPHRKQYVGEQSIMGFVAACGVPA
ncbi:protein of unknown function [Ralstonia solanacearum PSI07]|nr:protein of unknown function [Ralstonia solanacearum PSI07]